MSALYNKSGEEGFMRCSCTCFLNRQGILVCADSDASVHQRLGLRIDPNYLIPIPSYLGQKQS